MSPRARTRLGGFPRLHLRVGSSRARALGLLLGFPGAAGWAGPDLTQLPVGPACSTSCADLQTETHHRQGLRPSPQLPSPTPGRSPSPLQPPPPRDPLPERTDPRHLSSPSQHIRDPALPLTHCVTPEEPPPLSGLQCPHLYNKDLKLMSQKALALLHP